jgi:hypothetical protein
VIRRVFLTATIAVALTAGAPGIATATSDDPSGTPPPVTANPFLPEDRDVTDCISALPKPGCGSEERGGWRQGLILVAVLGGLAVIAWRIIAGVRRGTASPSARDDDTVITHGSRPSSRR